MKTDDTIGTRSSEPTLHGVGGWLLVLCLYLMALVPLLAILGLVGAWQSAAASPALQSSLVFGTLFELVLAGFAIYAGWGLYRLRPNAAAIVKIYFIVMLTLGVLGLAMAVLGSLTQNPDRVLANLMRGPAVVAGVEQIVLAVAWLFSLERSKRVRATYPRQ